MDELNQFHINKIAGMLDEIVTKLKASTKELEALDGKIDQHLLEDHAAGRPALRLIPGGQTD